MHSWGRWNCALALALTAITWTSAIADELPAAREVQFSVHTIPGNPSSPVKWTLQYQIHAEALDGNSVSWEVDQLTVNKHYTNGGVEQSWTRAAPELGTANGLWIVWHADPLEPDNDDSWFPPEYLDFLDDAQSDPALLVYTKGFSGPEMDFAFRLKDDPKPLDSGSSVSLEVDTWEL